MGDLIDFGKFAQTAIAFQNMQQNAERNALTSEGLDVQRAHQRLEQQRINQEEFKQLMTLADDPRVKANPSVGDALMSRAARLAGFPELSHETIERGRHYMRKGLDSLANGTPEEAHDALSLIHI